MERSRGNTVRGPVPIASGVTPRPLSPPDSAKARRRRRSAEQAQAAARGPGRAHRVKRPGDHHQSAPADVRPLHPRPPRRARPARPPPLRRAPPRPGHPAPRRPWPARRRRSPAARRRAGDHLVAGAHPEGLEHLVQVAPAQQAQHPAPRPRYVELVGERRRRGPGAVGVVGTVEHQQRRPVHHLEPPRQAQSRERLAPPRRAPAAGRRTPPRPRPRPRRCRPGGRRGPAGTRPRARPLGVRRSTTWPPRASRSAITPKSRSRSHTSAGPSASNSGSSAGSGLAEDQVAAGLDDARLLLGDAPPPVAAAVGVVLADVGDDRHLAVRHVGGVPAPEQAHLDRRHVHRHLAEPGEAGGREQLEVRRPLPEEPLVLQRLELADDPGELLGLDRLAVAGDPLGDVLEVRARIAADRRAGGRRAAPRSCGRSSPCRWCRSGG